MGDVRDVRGVRDGDWGVGYCYWRVGGVGVRCPVHYCVEPVVVICGVFDRALAAVWFDQGVRTVDDVSVAFFLLGFGVSGVVVLQKIVLTALAEVAWADLHLPGPLDKI